MREVPLTHGRVALVDDEDFPLVSAAPKWNAVKSDQTNENWYAMRQVKIDGRWTTIYMHRAIMRAPPGIEIDHENGNGLDNQKANLRPCKRSLNNANNKWALGSSGYRGVYPKGVRWAAHIQVNGVQRWLGSYADKVDAARAFDAAALAAFGEFATLNFPVAAP